jgi:O-antigen ligase
VLPSLSVVAGFLIFEPFFGYPAIFSEFPSGVSRLQGAVVPAHLAFLALAGTLCSVAMYEHGLMPGRRAAVAVAVNVLILGATLTRTALVALAILLFPAFWRLIRHRDIAARYVMVSFATLFLLTAWFAVLGPELRARSRTSASGGGLDTSGRTEAWAFYLEAVQGNEWLGLGLGAATVVTRYSVEFSQYFSVPHNEYLRAFVDGGWIGLTLLLVGLVASGVSIIRAAAPVARPTLLGMMTATLILAVTDNAFSTVQYLVPTGLAVAAIVSLNQSNLSSSDISAVQRP